MALRLLVSAAVGVRAEWQALAAAALQQANHVVALHASPAFTIASDVWSATSRMAHVDSVDE